MNLSATRLFAALVLFPSMSLAACTDRNPAGFAAPEPPPSAVAMLTCTVRVAAGTVACGAPDAGAPGASAAILGGQGSNVRLASTGMAYDGDSIFRMDVTVENLTAQALGTADGVTPSSDGVRVFFHSGPTATAGEGTVSVANADGEAIVLAAAQKYFQYDGILPPGDTTPLREWRFSLPNTVTSFTFGVYVAAPVRAEAGWAGMSPIAPAVAVGDTQRVVATLRTPTGGATGGAVSWSTSDPAVATVDANGLVTGVAAGTATIAATRGDRTGSVEVLVHAPTPNPPPEFVGWRMNRASITSGVPADSLWFWLKYRGTGGVAPYMFVTLRHSTGITRACVSRNPDPGVGETPEYACGTNIPDGLRGGAWIIDRIEFGGRVIQHAALLAAGAPAFVHIHTADEDNDVPLLDSMVIHTTTVDAAADTFAMELWVADRLFTRADAFFSGPGNPRATVTSTTTPPVNGRSAHQFRWQVPMWYNSGTFVLDSLRLRDLNGNQTTVARAEMEGRGFWTQFRVTNTTPDTVPPAITEFSFSPGTVVGNELDSASVVLGATDAPETAGIAHLEVEFQKVGSSFSTARRWQLIAATRALTRTLRVRISFAAADAGTWRVNHIRATDFMGNVRTLSTAEMALAGYPTELVVTAP
ncbi:MAG TPA: Ig-like domain-containing protein [Longimicrobium sp.]